MQRFDFARGPMSGSASELRKRLSASTRCLFISPALRSASLRLTTEGSNADRTSWSSRAAIDANRCITADPGSPQLTGSMIPAS